MTIDKLLSVTLNIGVSLNYDLIKYHRQDLSLICQWSIVNSLSLFPFYFSRQICYTSFMRTIIAIGGGEIKNKQTLEIDRYIAQKAKSRAGDKRANALFLGTASHDSMPYFNSFRKTYTSVFDIKAEVALLVYGEMDDERIRQKFTEADMIYVGGGDTKFMLEVWHKRNIIPLLRDAYDRGVIIAGLSAGAVCWFDKAYSDFDIMCGGGEYKVFDGLGWLNGLCCPHYDLRHGFDGVASDYALSYALENNAAIEFTDGNFSRVISAGGNAWRLANDKKEIIENNN